MSDIFDDLDALRLRPEDLTPRFRMELGAYAERQRAEWAAGTRPSPFREMLDQLVRETLIRETHRRSDK